MKKPTLKEIAELVTLDRDRYGSLYIKEVNHHVYGNVIGDVLGDVGGHITGNVGGDVDGQIMGDVTCVHGDIKFLKNMDIQLNMESKRFIIGIDGGLHTGVAVWDTTKKEFVHMKTVDFWIAYEWISSSFSANETMVYVEDPSQNKPVWRRRGMKDYEFSKKCQSVGAVKRETTLLIKGLRIKGFQVKAIRPKKGSYTKMKADTFKKLTKCKMRSSQHARDAAMLVFNR